MSYSSVEVRDSATNGRTLPQMRPRSLFTAHSTNLQPQTQAVVTESVSPATTTSQVTVSESSTADTPVSTVDTPVNGANTVPDSETAPAPLYNEEPVVWPQRHLPTIFRPTITLAAGATVAPHCQMAPLWAPLPGRKLAPCEPCEIETVPGPMATSTGTIMITLFDCVRVDISLNGAVRLINFRSNIVMAVSASGTSAALIHPNGRVRQYGSRVELTTCDANGNNKYAKMWYKGVSFTSDTCALVYLVDSAGLRSTTDTFPDLSSDFSLDVFYLESQYGVDKVQECLSAIEEARCWVAEDGSEVWDIAGVRISQLMDGQVKIAIQRSSGKRLLKTSVALGTAAITTPLIHTTASLGQNPHMFVRRGERRLHYDVTNFVVRNAGHSAGFDQWGRLKVY